MAFLDKCNGCRACEVACSFHHELAFQPSKSSIEVISVNDGYEGYEINLFKKSQNGRFACDRCSNLEEPACIKYCNVEVRENLRQLLYSSWNQ